jgi:hypothetical protein
MMLKRRPKSMIHAHRGDHGERSNPTASLCRRRGAGGQDACAAGVLRASYRARVQAVLSAQVAKRLGCHRSCLIVLARRSPGAGGASVGALRPSAPTRW